MTLFDEMMKKASSADGFIAALDQSGGSTPKALQQYGVPDDAYTEGEESMYEMVHQMRTRMITSPSFSGDKILGAILFEDTMDRTIEDLPTGQFLWEKKGIIPFIKCDKGLASLENGVQLMKPMPQLDGLLKKSVQKNMFGTKMRSVIQQANPDGIKAVVDQQFEIGKQILASGLCPILEPEVDINSPDKETIEDLLKTEMLKGLDSLDETQNVMIKLSLPTKVNHYKELIAHPRCVRVVALSGGYPRDEANEILSKQEGMIASFSRALLEGLAYEQDQADFDKTLAETVDSIYQASKAPL
ncbi:fructose-bisphosphate aldolase [Nitzschia inconspicua]|uniref:Fructose-bisphosphate aldolase n=1 Tax=Nitzschia inconspicua TaxID=303405 RepID=A0A9K3K8L1_9STRA|nr:fructose-bisphosphate aldolase [Nitzschia inconspicua]KAG7374872.1 fructose-bisphosphate aldolase [Nitzschia inconspicua]